ncbi:MAG TPA: hypothetical protein VFF73_33975 [Planctomycetota bacterium]|nr:hypothetical protein [Planctomycetota bacterium]
MKKLAQHNRDLVLDLLAERLAVARTETRIQGALIDRPGLAQDEIAGKALPLLARLRQDTVEHTFWLQARIRELGGDPESPGPRARLAATEASGIAQIAFEPGRSIAEVFHALMALALVDHAGWFTLLNLAAEAEDEVAQESLRRKIDDANDELHALRTIVQAFARRDLLGIVTDVSRKAA